jgi:hypothetical protein
MVVQDEREAEEEAERARKRKEEEDAARYQAELVSHLGPGVSLAGRGRADSSCVWIHRIGERRRGNSGT